MNGKTPALLALVLFAVLATALLTFQPYSADSTGRDYIEPVRGYLQAAFRQDSMALVRRSTSKAPVRWALDAVRAHPDTLAFWRRGIQAWTGQKWADTAEVYVYPAGEACGNAPIVFQFVGIGDHARVVRASSTCFGPS